MSDNMETKSLSQLAGVHQILVEEMIRRKMNHTLQSEIDTTLTGWAGEKTLSPSSNPSGMTKEQLLDAVKELRVLFDEKADGRLDTWTREEIVNLFALIADELADRGETSWRQDHSLDDMAQEFRRKSLEFATVNPSGNVLGPEITLDQVLQHIKPFKLRSPYVYLVGGLVANGKTVGDIDILIKDATDEISPKMRKVIEWRILRSLPVELRDRVQFIYDEFHGPFTDYIELFDLGLGSVREKFEVRHMALTEPRAATPERAHQAATALKEDRVVVGEFFSPPKPTKPAYPEVRQSPEIFMELMDYFGYPWFFEKKYDGLRMEVHRDGDKVVYLSEDGTEYKQERFPEATAAFLKLKGQKFILDVELEKWDGKQHLPREVVSGQVHQDDGGEDGLVWNIHDVVFFDGPGDSDWQGDLHKRPRRLRLEVLSELGVPQSTLDVPDTTKILNLVPHQLVENASQASSALQTLRRKPGSEGIVAKQVESTYPLDGTSQDQWIKFHNNVVVRAVIIEPVETATPGVFNYWYGFLPGRRTIKDEDVVEIDGSRYFRSGKTFSTAKEFNKGDVVSIEAESGNFIHDFRDDTWQLTFWVPRVLVEVPGARPDTMDEAARKAEMDLVLQEKEIDREGQIVYKELEVQDQDPYLEVPPEDKTYRYVVQHHWRGRSVHGDLRIERDPGKVLIGWTMNIAKPNVASEPVTTLAEAKAQLKPDNFKVFFPTGVWAQRDRRGTDEPVTTSILSERKAPEPFAWLNVEGVTRPGAVGATRNFPGVFQIVDEGTVEYGAQKPWLHEYFFHSSGSGLRYRMFYRQLRIQSAEKQEVLPPSNAPDVAIDEPTWLAIKPDDQTPYVLSDEAVLKAWMPLDGLSALPKSIRSQMPEKFRFWTKKGKEAMAVRDAAVEALKSGELKLDFEAPYVKQAAADRFTIQHQTWKGPQVIREGPSRELWFLSLTGDGKVERFTCELNPLLTDSVSGYLEPTTPSKMSFRGEASPGHFMNPTRATPSWVTMEDSGEVVWFINNPDFKKFELRGQQVKLLLWAKRNEGVWLLSRSELPETSTGKRVDKRTWDVEEDLEFIVSSEVLKVDKDKRLVTSIVLTPEKVDLQGDIISADVIEKAAHDFLAQYNRSTELGLMHKFFGNLGIDLVESWIEKGTNRIGDKRIIPGTWLMTMRVHDKELWDKVRDGTLRGFSIGGVASVAPIEGSSNSKKEACQAECA